MGIGGETSLGGRQRDFPSTCWSRFSSGAADRAALEELARGYWKPVYAYLRARFSQSNESAKDLTQDFFVWIVESDLLSRADPAKGRFRAFLKTALQNYFYNEERRQNRLKRGGGREIFALEIRDEEVDVPDAAGRNPEEALDDAWRREVLGRAAERLEQACRTEGKEAYYKVFHDFYLQGPGATNYKELSARHGISESDISNYLVHAKRRFREIVAALVTETVESPPELREELKSLFGPDWK